MVDLVDFDEKWIDDIVMHELKILVTDPMLNVTAMSS